MERTGENAEQLGGAHPLVHEAKKPLTEADTVPENQRERRARAPPARLQPRRAYLCWWSWH